MLAYDIKHILAIVPEAKPLVKQANLEEDFPVDCESSYVASVLRREYMTKVAGKSIPSTALDQMHKAAGIYSLPDSVAPMLDKIASYRRNTALAEDSKADFVKAAQVQLEDSIHGLNVDLEKAAGLANELYMTAGEDALSAEAKKYAGVGYLDKEAAVKGLINRYSATNQPVFLKVARVIADSPEGSMSREDIVGFGRMVSSLEKEAGIHGKGWDIFEEAVVKSAASVLTITLAGKQVPYEAIAKVGKDRISSIVGKEVADALTGDPVTDKHVIESLPLDLQRILASVIKGV